MYRCESWTIKKAEHWRIKPFELCCWRRLLRVPWTARRSNQSILKEISPNIHWKDWCWSWNSNTLATWCRQLTHLKKKPWCWERLKAKEEGGDREWDGWMTSLSMDMSLSKLWDMVNDREAWCAAVPGITKNQIQLSNWMTALGYLQWNVTWFRQGDRKRFSYIHNNNKANVPKYYQLFLHLFCRCEYSCACVPAQSCSTVCNPGL